MLLKSFKHNPYLNMLHITILITLIQFCVIISTKDLATDIEQITKDIEEWEDVELDEGYDIIDADKIPGLDGKELHIVEKIPNSEGQSYIVYKQSSADEAKYIRLSAYIRRFRGYSAVEWNPIENPADNVADGDFISFFIPNSFTNKRCNSIVRTPRNALYNYFYKHDDQCTLPTATTPFQDCCGSKDSIREELDVTAKGRSFSGTVAEESYADNNGIEKRATSHISTTSMSDKLKEQGAKITKVIAEDIKEELKDKLQTMSGPLGYEALGEFFENILDLANDSKQVYETRARIEFSKSSSDLKKLETHLFANFEKSSSTSKLPSFSDPKAPYTGILSCNYTKFTTKRQDYDKIASNVAKFYIHHLRAQCVPHAFKKTMELFENEFLQVTTGLRTELNSESEILFKSVVTKQDWIDTISAVHFVTFSSSYMDTLEKISRAVNDNQNPIGDEISWNARTTTIMALRIVGLADVLLETHVIKILQIAASMVKENFLVTLHQSLILESYCQANNKGTSSVECKHQLQVAENDLLQLLSLVQFIVFGTSWSLQRKHYTLQDEFNLFYIKTLDHVKSIMENIRSIREPVETLAKKEAEENTDKIDTGVGTSTPTKVTPAKEETIEEIPGGNEAGGEEEEVEYI